MKQKRRIIKPNREDLLKIMEEKKKIFDCIEFFQCGYKTFKKWLYDYDINYNFIDNRNNNIKYTHTEEAIKKSAKTRSKNGRKKILCLMCRNDFLVIKASKKKFCSINCWYRYRKEVMIQNKIMIFCDYCNIKVFKYPSFIKEKNNFCSYKCSNFYYKGKTYENRYGKEKSEEIKNKIRDTSIINNSKMPFFTKPYKLLKEAMVNNNFYNGFETSGRVSFWEIDELNKEKKICIEVDGDYWHNLPKVIKRDKRKNKYLTNLGYTVIRFWEHEIYNDIDGCLVKLSKIC